MKVFIATIVLLCLDFCFCLDDKRVTDLTVPSSQKEDGSNRLYYQGTDFTINLFPLVFLKLGLLFIAFLISGKDMTTFAEDTMGYFTGSGSSPASSYGAPTATGYGAPDTSYGAPATGYGATESSYEAPSYSAPSTGYGSPSYANQYAANRFAASEGGFQPGFQPGVGGPIPLAGAQAQGGAPQVNYYAQQQQQQQQPAQNLDPRNNGIQNLIFGTPTDDSALPWQQQQQQQQPAQGLRTYAHRDNAPSTIDRLYTGAHENDEDLTFNVGTSLDFGARTPTTNAADEIVQQMGFDSAEKAAIREYEEMLSTVPQTVQSILSHNEADGFVGSQEDVRPVPTHWAPVAGALRKRK